MLHQIWAPDSGARFLFWGFAGGVEPGLEVNDVPVGPEPAAASGGNRQAERRKSQGAMVHRDYASFPDAEGDNYDSDTLQ